MNLPAREECLKILEENKTPSNVVEHLKAVCWVSEQIMQRLKKRKIVVKEELVIAAALLHDVVRLKENHVIEGAKLVRKLGYPEVARVMEKHSLYHINDQMVQPCSIEEKIVFYADKRALGSKIVSVEQRFADLKKRYNLSHLDREYEFTKGIERELLGDNPEL